MKNSLIITCCLLSFSISLFAQRPIPSKADSLRDQGDLVAAIDVYKDQIKSSDNPRADTYNLACAYALTWAQDSAFHYLLLATENDTTVQALNDPDLLGLTKHEKWAAFEEDMIHRVEAKFGPYKKRALSQELWRMKMKDQAYYYHIKIAKKQMGDNSPVVKALWDLKHKINDENLKRIEEIIAENGWPKESEVKGSAAGTVFLVIQHAELEAQKKYVGLFKEACEAGEGKWSSYALMYDRIEMREGRPQLYGSQISTNRETGSLEIHEIADPEYVNQRRKKMGLGPLEDYVKNWNLTWDVPQKEK